MIQILTPLRDHLTDIEGSLVFHIIFISKKFLQINSLFQKKIDKTFFLLMNTLKIQTALLLFAAKLRCADKFQKCLFTGVEN